MRDGDSRTPGSLAISHLSLVTPFNLSELIVALRQIVVRPIILVGYFVNEEVLRCKSKKR